MFHYLTAIEKNQTKQKKQCRHQRKENAITSRKAKREMRRIVIESVALIYRSGDATPE